MIARLPDGTWSAPSCIATGGVGFGLQIGADLSEFVVVLNSDEAISAFAKGGNLTIGGSLAAAAGPIGVGGAVNTAILNPAPMFTYSKSKGLYAGVSLEGTVLVERVSRNGPFLWEALIVGERARLTLPTASSALAERCQRSLLRPACVQPAPFLPFVYTTPLTLLSVLCTHSYSRHQPPRVRVIRLALMASCGHVLTRCARVSRHAAARSRRPKP